MVSVAAPVGSGKDAALTGTAAWSLAITTGAEFADVAEPFGLLGEYDKLHLYLIS